MTTGLYEALTGTLPAMAAPLSESIVIPRGFYTPGFWTALACRALIRGIPFDAIQFADNENRGYAQAMRLPEILGGADEYEYTRIRDGKTYSSLEHLNCAEATDGATSRIKKCIRSLFAGTDAAQFVDGVGNIVAELHANVWSHGLASGISMAQRWGKNEFEFALADRGLGCLRELRRVGRGVGFSDENAIEWCIQQGHTTRPGHGDWAQRLPADAIGNPYQGIEVTTDSDVHHAGLGLWKFVELIRLFRGHAWIASGRACLLLSLNEKSSSPLSLGRVWRYPAASMKRGLKLPRCTPKIRVCLPFCKYSENLHDEQQENPN